MNESNSDTEIVAFDVSKSAALTADDMFYPKLRLSQQLTAEVVAREATAGKWLLLGEQPRDEVTVVPLAMKKRRELRDKARDILCSSDDGVIGVGEPGGVCAACPLSQWTAKGSAGVPRCTFIYEYMVYVVEADQLSVFDTKRTSINIGKTMNTLAAHKGWGNFAVKLTAAAKTSPGMPAFYTPAVSPTTVDLEVLVKARGVKPAE